jgi:hypothetical protein
LIKVAENCDYNIDPRIRENRGFNLNTDLAMLTFVGFTGNGAPGQNKAGI